MAIYRGNTELSKIYRGNTEINKIYRGQDEIYSSAFYDDFLGTSLNTSAWSTFGTSYGSVTVSGGICTITNTSGSSSNRIGIYTNKTFGVGMTLTVRSRNTSGRHSGLIGFGESPWAPYPHDGTSKGVSWYSRADDISSTLSWNDDNGTTGYYDSVTEDLRSWQTFKIIRVNSSSVEVYRNDSLEHTISATFANNYSVYFSTDGWYNPATIEVDWVQIEE